MNKLIVAHYKEDISWVDTIPAGWLPKVITKDVMIPNIGREPHTFLYWIIENYDLIRKDNLYAFVQGRPFDHCPELMRMLADLQTATMKPSFKYAALGVHWHNSDGAGRPAHSGLPVAECYEKWIGKPFPITGVEFVAGGQFIVSGAAIKARPKEFYQRMSDDIVTYPDSVPWVCERLWQEVFNGVYQ
jgi:hypothetical protein